MSLFLTHTFAYFDWVYVAQVPTMANIVCAEMFLGDIKVDLHLLLFLDAEMM